MKLIDHPNILRLYDVWETSTDLYLIMEYVEGGELFDYLCSKGRLSTSEALGYFQQLISAVHYCHQFNIAHRDLKPENLLLDVNKNIKVADFGLAAYGANDVLLNTFCGSPHYAAPEVISGQVYNGSCSDTWSCGIILHALLVGKLPFESEDCQVLKQQILRAEFRMPRDTDPLARDLVSRMLEKDVTKRITIPEILKHPFFTSQPPKELDRAVPTLDSIARPIRSPSCIDTDIFSNLRTLWPDTPGKQLAECLLNDEKNWQKGIYHLLVEYRSRHLENYDEEEELLKQREARRSKKAKAASQVGREMPSTGSGPDRSLSSLPPRAAPPTPNRARRRQDISVSSVDGSPSMHQYNESDIPSAISPTSPQSPIWAALNLPPLDVPELEDEKMQQFFHQIVEHLNAMQQRTLALSPVPGASPTMDTRTEPPANAPADPEVVVGVTNRTPQNRVFMPVTDKNAGMRPLTLRRPKKPIIEILTTQAEKENKGENGFLVADKVKKKSSLKKHKERPSESSAGRKVKIVEPDVTKLLRKKKSSGINPVSPALASLPGVGSGISSPGSTLPSPSSLPKRTWFDSVFRIKPATHRIFSSHDAQTARSECRRMLMGLGAHVMLTQAEGLGVLKCRMDEVQDPAGTMTVTKGVKFRVEMHDVDEVKEAEGYAVGMLFVLEKGAGSTFKMIFEKMSREWASVEGKGDI